MVRRERVMSHRNLRYFQAVSMAATFVGASLAHALTIWIFAGALIFSAFMFLPVTGAWWMRVLKHPAWLMLGIFAIFYTPWLVRNYQVCGSPFGISGYSALYQIRGTESQVMRALKLDIEGVNPTTFRNKVQNQIVGQLSDMYAYLGRSLAAPRMRSD